MPCACRPRRTVSNWPQSYAGSPGLRGDAGRLLFEAELPGPNLSYRATLQQWVGLPLSPPVAAARRSNGKVTVYDLSGNATGAAASFDAPINALGWADRRDWLAIRGGTVTNSDCAPKRSEAL